METVAEMAPEINQLPTISRARFVERVSKERSTEEKEEIVALLMEFQDCFARTEDELGQCKLVQYRIDTGEAKPIHQQPYKSSWKEREIIDKQVRSMLANDSIEPSASPWSSPVVLVKKKDGEWRFCVDFRRLNEVTRKDVYPLPNIQAALLRLQYANFFTGMNMQSGYHQISMHAEDRHKTAFVTADGLNSKFCLLA